VTTIPGALSEGRYRVVGVLGEGAQATTFDAVDERGLAVAVKRFRVHGARSWKEVELAEREATVLAGLSHPLLPRYLEHFEEGGELFLVTEKIEGESLAAMRKRGRAFTEAEVIALLRDAGEALAYLHGRTPPIVHRDLKPSNVIRRPDGSFAFIDFGAVANRLKPEGGSTVVGTFGYMAPEQFQGRARPASDVYAIGATALSLLTGREPEDLPHRGLGIDVPAALAGCRVRADLVALLASMLAPAPEDRLQTLEPLGGPGAPEREAPAPARVAPATRAPRAARPKPSRKNARDRGLCRNPDCDRGLVGDDLCPLCRGSGEAEPAPEPRPKTAPAKPAAAKARCPNPGCNGGLIGHSLCPRCRGSGEAVPAPERKPKPTRIESLPVLPPPDEAKEGTAPTGEGMSGWIAAALGAAAGLVMWSWNPDGLPRTWLWILIGAMGIHVAERLMRFVGHRIARAAELEAAAGEAEADALGPKARIATADPGGARVDAPPAGEPVRARVRLDDDEDDAEASAAAPDAVRRAPRR
jgi:hypothetical protein